MSDKNVKFVIYKNQMIPIVKKTFFKVKTEKELKEKVIEYVKLKYLGKTFEKSVGNKTINLELSWQGLKNDINEYHSNYIEKLYSFVELPLIIKNAKYISTEKDKRGRTDVKAVYRFYSKVIINTIEYDVILIVYETAKTYLYDHILIK